jgi:hypothetical protein
MLIVFYSCAYVIVLGLFCFLPYLIGRYVTIAADRASIGLSIKQSSQLSLLIGGNMMTNRSELEAKHCVYSLETGCGIWVRKGVIVFIRSLSKIRTDVKQNM